LIFTIIALLFSACNITKHVPDNEYLLNSSRIQTDVNDISKDELNTYLRQQPNAKVLGFWNLSLSVYNIAPKDTTNGFKRFMSKTMKRLGNEPVIYDESLTRPLHSNFKNFYQIVVILTRRLKQV